jgi:beta-phosphoglucomutase-like phosphatase (HAD superfamily)
MPALLLDLDGTMLDTDRLHFAVFARIMERFGVTMDEAYYRAHIHGRRNVDYFAEAIPDHPDPQGLSDEKEAAFRDILAPPLPRDAGCRGHARPGAKRRLGQACRRHQRAARERRGDAGRHRTDATGSRS